jgi:hypothetical protein
MRPTFIAKEAYAHGKRSLFIWRKRMIGRLKGRQGRAREHIKTYGTDRNT